MTIGERIRSRRESLGISQVSLADAIGEKKQTLYKYENNIVTNIPIDKIALIAEALKTTPAFIMGWNEDDFTKEFREALANALYNADLFAAKEDGINVDELESIALGNEPLTFEKACEVADLAGISLDALLGREEQKKKPAPENEDRLDAEIYELLMALSPEKLEAAKSYLRYLKSQEENP